MNAKKRNILFMMPDQLRSDFLSCYGADFIETKHLDALCEPGIRYERAVSPTPVCVPARASLLTGQNAIKNGVFTNQYWLRPDKNVFGQYTWPERLAKEGYRTASIGKMHFYPFDVSEGFQERIIAEEKTHLHIHDDYEDYLKEHGYRKYHGIEFEGWTEHKGAAISIVPEEHQVDNWVANQTCRYIENYDSEQPFALMVGFPGPHPPIDPPPELAGLFAPADMPDSIPATPESEVFRPAMIVGHREPCNQLEYEDLEERHKKKLRAHYAALVHQIDKAVGRIVETLKRTGKYDETVIIFSSDHGEYLGDYNLMGKQTFFEPSIRVPMIVHHPDIKEPAVVKHTVSLTDVYSTILAVAGVEQTIDNDSVPLPGLPELAGERPHERAYVFGCMKYADMMGSMVTDDEWKYCRYSNGLRLLYHLPSDPQEQRNLANDPRYAAQLTKMDDAMYRETTHAMLAASIDKKVDGPGAVKLGPFNDRGWIRPYPYPMA